MATPFQERSPCQTASYPRVRRAFTGKASCSALRSWRLTTSGSAFANQAKRLSSRLLMLLMLKVATFTKSLFCAIGGIATTSGFPNSPVIGSHHFRCRRCVCYDLHVQHELKVLRFPSGRAVV